jgi:hypothetical protein
MGFTCGMNGGKEKIMHALVGNLKEGDHLQERFRHTDNIKIDIEERNRVGEYGMD